MPTGTGRFRAFRARMGDRAALWRVRRAPTAGGFVQPPEPLLSGSFAQGRQLVAGSFALAGQRIEAPDPWAAPAPSVTFGDELHGFGWLDHLGAVGDRPARLAAQALVDGWIARHGAGPQGWRADLCGRRVLRWVDQGIMLGAGRDDAAMVPFFASLGRQMAFLARRWQAAPPGPARIEAVAGWVIGALMLRGMADHLTPAQRALAEVCATEIDADGGIPSRNPQALATILHLLVRLAQAHTAVDRRPPPVLTQTTARIAEVLRKLRHVDGGLARFHGGGRGAEGPLERALAEVGALHRPRAKKRRRHRLARAWDAGLHMGYARLATGRVSVIVDAAPPPSGADARNAHASTLAFELTSNRRPVIVSSGPGGSFGAEWQKAGRATLSHSTLSIDGWSSARFSGLDRSATAPLTDGPRQVELHRTDERHASALLLSHDGYLATHGLTHVRSLDLSADGRALMGEDRLVVLDPAHRPRFERMQTASPGGIRFALRFHLHPDADASLDMSGAAVSIALPSGEIWVLRFDGPGTLSLEPSVWLEPGRPAPRASRQAVIRAQMASESAQINWTLAKAQDTPLAIRDIGRDDPLHLPEPLVSDD